MEKKPQHRHAVALVREGFAKIEAYEKAKKKRQRELRSEDPNKVASAVLETPDKTGA